MSDGIDETTGGGVGVQKGQIVRAVEPMGPVVITKLYEVGGRSPSRVRLKGVRGYWPATLFKVVEPDELEAIEQKVAQLQRKLVHVARLAKDHSRSVTPEVVLGMVLMQLRAEEMNGSETNKEVCEEANKSAGREASGKASGEESVDAPSGAAETGTKTV